MEVTVIIVLLISLVGAVLPAAISGIDWLRLPSVIAFLLSLIPFCCDAYADAHLPYDQKKKLLFSFLKFKNPGNYASIELMNKWTGKAIYCNPFTCGPTVCKHSTTLKTVYGRRFEHFDHLGVLIKKPYVVKNLTVPEINNTDPILKGSFYFYFSYVPKLYIKHRRRGMYFYMTKLKQLRSYGGESERSLLKEIMDRLIGKEVHQDIKSDPEWPMLSHWVGWRSSQLFNHHNGTFDNEYSRGFPVDYSYTVQEANLRLSGKSDYPVMCLYCMPPDITPDMFLRMHKGNVIVHIQAQIQKGDLLVTVITDGITIYHNTLNCGKTVAMALSSLAYFFEKLMDEDRFCCFAVDRVNTTPIISKDARHYIQHCSNIGAVIEHVADLFELEDAPLPTGINIFEGIYKEGASIVTAAMNEADLNKVVSTIGSANFDKVRQCVRWHAKDPDRMDFESTFFGFYCKVIERGRNIKARPIELLDDFGNWQWKRLWVDLSYFREKAGGKYHPGVDPKVNPTLKAQKLFGSVDAVQWPLNMDRSSLLVLMAKEEACFLKQKINRSGVVENLQVGLKMQSVDSHLKYIPIEKIPQSTNIFNCGDNRVKTYREILQQPVKTYDSKTFNEGLNVLVERVKRKHELVSRMVQKSGEVRGSTIKESEKPTGKRAGGKANGGWIRIPSSKSYAPGTSKTTTIDTFFKNINKNKYDNNPYFLLTELKKIEHRSDNYTRSNRVKKAVFHKILCSAETPEHLLDRVALASAKEKLSLRVDINIPQSMLSVGEKKLEDKVNNAVKKAVAKKKAEKDKQEELERRRQQALAEMEEKLRLEREEHEREMQEAALMQVKGFAISLSHKGKKHYHYNNLNYTKTKCCKLILEEMGSQKLAEFIEMCESVGF